MHVPSGLPRPLAVATLAGVVLLSSCTYESSSGVSGRPGPQQGDGIERVVPDPANPDAPLAFSVDGLSGEEWTVINTESGLNLREGAGTGTPTMAQLAEGSSVVTTGVVTEVDNVAWFEVRAGTFTGWVHSGYLEPEGNLSTDAAAFAENVEPVAARWPAGTELVVTVSPGANLRSEAQGDVVSQLPTNTPVVATGVEQGQWMEVTAGSLTGWVWMELVGLTEVARNELFPAGTTVGVAPGHDGLNVRAVPDGEIVVGIPVGETASATGRSQDGWTEVNYRNITGWSQSALLIELQGELVTELTGRTVSADGAIITAHRGPSGAEPVVARLGDLVSVLITGITTADGWTQIRLDDGGLAWVPTELLR